MTEKSEVDRARVEGVQGGIRRFEALGEAKSRRRKGRRVEGVMRTHVLARLGRCSRVLPTRSSALLGSLWEREVRGDEDERERGRGRDEPVISQGG